MDQTFLLGLVTIAFSISLFAIKRVFYTFCTVIAYPFHLVIQIFEARETIKGYLKTKTPSTKKAPELLQLPAIAVHQVAQRHWTDQTAARRIVYSLFGNRIQKRVFDIKTRKVLDTFHSQPTSITQNALLKDVKLIFDCDKKVA